MNDERFEPVLSAWLKGSMATPPDARQSAATVAARLPTTSQRGRWRPPVVSLRARRGSAPMTPMPRYAAAAVFVALIGGALLLGVLASQSDEEASVVGASASPSVAPSIQWGTEVVDMQADSFGLDVNDLTFTTGSGVAEIDSDPGDSTYWTLEITWFEHDVEQRLNMYFGSDGTEWWVDEIRTYDGYERVYAYGPFFSTPLGETYEDDVLLDLVGEGRPPGGDGRPGAVVDTPPPEPVRATLTIDGLRLSVTPSTRPGPVREPSAPNGSSFIDDLADGVRDLLGDGQRQKSEASDIPVATETIDYAGVALGVERVGDGALRIVEDGTEHEVDSPIMDIAVAPDGTVWAAKRRWVFALGVPGQVSTDRGGPRLINRIDVAPDGTLLVRGGPGGDSEGQMATLDGETWTAVPPSPLVTYSNDDVPPTWASDGSLWRGVSGAEGSGVGRLDDGSWTLHRVEDVAPIATTASQGWLARQPIQPIAATPDGAVWAATDSGSLSRFDGESWQEFRPLDALLGEATDGVDAIGPGDLAAGADGTVWAVMGADDVYLVRHDGVSSDVFPLSEIMPGARFGARGILVDDRGALIFVASLREDGSAADGRSRPTVIAFDGATVTRLGSLPPKRAYRLSHLAPDGSVWLVGGSTGGHRDQDRIYIVGHEAARSVE